MRWIGELLVALGATTPEQLRAALDNQAVFGGRIGTNLLEMGAVSEEALAAALGLRFGVPSRSGTLEVAREALALLRPEMAARLEVVPASVEGRRLEVLVADPADLARLDEVAFATGRQVRPYVVAEARLWELLRRHYGIERVLRGIGEAGPYLAAAPERAGEPTAQPPADLMGEDAFEALYVSPAFAAASGPRLELGRAPRAHELDVDDPPLEPDEAFAAIAAAGDRRALGRALLRAARAQLRRAALLEVDADHAIGADALGRGVDRTAVAALRLRVRDAGVVGTVVRTRAHVLGPLLSTEQNLRLLRALGAGTPRNGFAMPVLVQGKVSAVLYGDAGADEAVDAAQLGDLLVVAARAAARYEQLAAGAL